MSLRLIYGEIKENCNMAMEHLELA